jgi:hypothetical protein
MQIVIRCMNGFLNIVSILRSIRVCVHWKLECTITNTDITFLQLDHAQPHLLPKHGLCLNTNVSALVVSLKV